MTIYLDSEEDRLDDIIASQQGLIDLALRANQQTVQLSELPEDTISQIERTKAVGANLDALPRVGFNDRLDPSKVTLAPQVQSLVGKVAGRAGLTSTQVDLGNIFDIASTPSRKEKTPLEKLEDAVRASLAGESMQSVDDAILALEEGKQALHDAEAVPREDQEIIDTLPLPINDFIPAATPHVEFPHLAREIMNLGLKMEEFHTQNRLNVYKKEGDEYKEKIDTLLKLAAELPKMNSDDGSYDLSEEAQAKILSIAAELKEKGIDIFPDVEINGQISKAQLAAANSLVNHHIDVSRTSLQELFTTKISVSIQFLQMMTEVMKKVADYNDRQVRKALEISR